MNTYLNSQIGTMAAYGDFDNTDKSSMINWADASSGNKTELCNIHHPSARNPTEDGFAIIRSCLKGGSQAESRIPFRNERSQLARNNERSVPKRTIAARN
jgi:hypothetical protein